MPESSNQKQPKYLLTLIVLSQFAGTALWFASNAILDNLTIAFQLPANALGYLTSAVQLGFISGTLLFAFYLIADRFSPSKVFMVCAALGALFNAGILFYNGGLWGLVSFRFLTGFCLAGIYPVGMKIASDWYQGSLGKALGYLVGALVFGTAFPHFLKFTIGMVDWKLVIVITSSAALLGGFLVGFLIPDGPFRKVSTKFEPKVIIEIFKFPKFRSAAFGYFGHMWELYAFWTFLPFFLLSWSNIQEQAFNIPLWAFIL
ncbi:MAG: MFS transporter, partial [Bacteroidota bacterium]